MALLKVDFPIPFVFLLLLFTLSPNPLAWSQVPSIELRGLSRLGGAAGTNFPLHITAGSHLDEVYELKFSTPSIRAVVNSKPLDSWDSEENNQERLSGQFVVSIDPNLVSGCYEVRALGRHGISNPLPFWVVAGRHSTRDETSSADSAAVIDRNQILWDHCAPQAVREFIIPAEQGERIALNTLSSMIDTKAALVLNFYSPSGKLLQRIRNLGTGEARVTVDCRETGHYKLQVHDHLHRGGWEYPFAVRRQSEDWVISSPLDLFRSQVDLLDRIGKRQPTDGLVPWPRLVESGTLRGVDPGQPVFIHDDLAFPERNAMPVAAPSLVEGRFDRNGDEDWIEFSASGGDVLYLELISQRLGYRTDPHLMIFRVERSSDGKESLQLIGEQDDGWDLGNEEVRIRSRDPLYRFQAPADGSYRVLIRDLQTDDGRPEENGWLLSLRPPKPDYTLMAYLPYPAHNPAASRPYGNSIARNDSGTIRVLAIRHDGFSDSIEVQVEGSPEGLQSSPSWIASNQNFTHVQLRSADQVESWVGQLSVIGIADADREHRHYAIPAMVADGPDGYRNSVVSRLGANITVAVNSLDEFPLTIELPGESDRTVARGEKLSLPITLRRKQGGNDRCILRPQQVPPKWNAGELTIEGNANEGSLEVQVASDAPLGKYSFWLLGETKIKVPWNPQAVERLQARKDRLAQYLEAPEQADNRAAIEQVLQTISEQLELAKKNAAEREFTVFVPSTPIVVEVVEPTKSE